MLIILLNNFEEKEFYTYIPVPIYSHATIGNKQQFMEFENHIVPYTEEDLFFNHMLWTLLLPKIH